METKVLPIPSAFRALAAGKAPVAAIEEALELLTYAWNVTHAFPEGPAVLHRIFGSGIGGLSAGHSIATRLDGTARAIGDAEAPLAAQVLAGVRAEMKEADRDLT